MLDDISLSACWHRSAAVLDGRTSPANSGAGMEKEEAHYIYVQFEDGTFVLLPAMHEADKVYQYYERKHARQREGVRSCWVVRPSDHQVVLGKAPANWSPNGRRARD